MSLCGVLVLPEGLVLPDPVVRARVARLLLDLADPAHVALHRLDPVREVVVLPLSRQSCSAAMARTSR
jgi:hypothetical protein